MNKNKMYCVRDTVACVWRVPFCDLNDASAIRAFTYMLSQIKVGQKSDYDLFAVGEFDISTGKVLGLEQPEFILGGANVEI